LQFIEQIASVVGSELHQCIIQQIASVVGSELHQCIIQQIASVVGSELHQCIIQQIASRFVPRGRNDVAFLTEWGKKVGGSAANLFPKYQFNSAL